MALFSDPVLTAVKSLLEGRCPVEIVVSLTYFLRRGMPSTSFLTTVFEGVTFDVLPGLRHRSKLTLPPPPILTSTWLEDDDFLDESCVILFVDMSANG